MKGHTYNLYDRTGRIICQDKTRAELLPLLGNNVNFGICINSGKLLQEKYRIEHAGEFERQNTLDDKLLADFESACRIFRNREWSKTEGFNLAAAWRRWKEKNKDVQI